MSIETCYKVICDECSNESNIISAVTWPTRDALIKELTEENWIFTDQGDICGFCAELLSCMAGEHAYRDEWGGCRHCGRSKTEVSK